MDIIYLGHSSFKITGKTASVVTDPFDSSMVGLKFPKTDASIVTVSHAHPDHNSVDSVSDVHKVINGPGEYEVKGISILGYQSFHDAANGSERGGNTIYVFEVDGFRIAHLGDLGHLPSDELIRDLGNIDILMLPVGGKYTINAEEAVKVTRAIEPVYVLPMHYKVSGLNEESFADLAPVEDFVKALGVVEERTKKLSLKPGTLLPEELKVVVL